MGDDERRHLRGSPARNAAPHPFTASELVDRREECLRLDQLVQEVRHRRSQALVVEGDPGVGKSTLLRYVLSQADEVKVGFAIATETEVNLPFATLAAVLEPFSDCFNDLAAAQRDALRAALGRGTSAPPDHLSVGAATLSCLAVMAEARPLLVVVDDGHWMDPSSAEALVFACRRLAHEGVGILIALREGEPTPFADAELRRLPVKGLARLDALALIGDCMAADVARAVVASTDGNPLAIAELSNLLSDTQRRGLEPLPDPLPVGETLERAFAHRIAQVSDAARRLLVAAAAHAGGEIGVWRDATRLMAIDERVLDEVLAAGLVELSGGRLLFAHPLLRASVYQAAPDELRREAHRALALALRRQDDLDRRAWHLAAAATGPNGEAAEALDRAAISAQERGAFAVAGAAFERAAGLSVHDDERARRLVEAGNAYMLGGQSARALRVLKGARASASDPLLRADIQLKTGVAGALAESVETALEETVRAGEEIQDVDSSRASALLSQASVTALVAGRPRDASALAKRAVACARKSTGFALLAATMAFAMAALARGAMSEAASQLQAFVDLFDVHGPSPQWFGAAEEIANALTWCERFADAQRVLDAMISEARKMGAPGMLPLALAVRADLKCWLGSWMEARADASEAASLAREVQQVVLLPYPLTTLGRLEAALGLEREARGHLREALELADRGGNRTLGYWAHGAMGFVELSAGRLGHAVAHLEPTEREIYADDVRHPSTLVWRADLIEAYARLGRRGKATRVHDRLQQLVECTNSRWARATADRTRGLMATADFDAHFEAALRGYDELPLPFERARAALSFAECLRRAHRPEEAVRQLRGARDTFTQLGALPWVTRVNSELTACGHNPSPSRPSGFEQLTAQELQVATQVAAGATNQEAAAALFIGRRTVEHHLASIYRKLGIHSRSQLVRLMP